jgi:non-ribosomal peptide synthetase component F
LNRQVGFLVANLFASLARDVRFSIRIVAAAPGSGTVSTVARDVWDPDPSEKTNFECISSMTQTAL